MGTGTGPGPGPGVRTSGRGSQSWSTQAGGVVGMWGEHHFPQYVPHSMLSPRAADWVRFESLFFFQLPLLSLAHELRRLWGEARGAEGRSTGRGCAVLCV